VKFKNVVWSISWRIPDAEFESVCRIFVDCSHGSKIISFTIQQKSSTLINNNIKIVKYFSKIPM